MLYPAKKVATFINKDVDMLAWVSGKRLIPSLVTFMDVSVHLTYFIQKYKHLRDGVVHFSIPGTIDELNGYLPQLIESFNFFKGKVP